MKLWPYHKGFSVPGAGQERDTRAVGQDSSAGAGPGPGVGAGTGPGHGSAGHGLDVASIAAVYDALLVRPHRTMPATSRMPFNSSKQGSNRPISLYQPTTFLV